MGEAAIETMRCGIGREVVGEGTAGPQGGEAQGVQVVGKKVRNRTVGGKSVAISFGTEVVPVQVTSLNNTQNRLDCFVCDW